MKISNIITISAAALVALTAVTAVAVSTYAQTNGDETGDVIGRGSKMGQWQNLTDEQRAELEATRAERQAERDAKQAKIQAAIDAGDYQAWVDAHDGNEPMLKNVTAENFFAVIEAQGYRNIAKENMEKVRTTLENAGIERGFGKRGGMMGGRGMHNFEGMGPGDLGR